MRSIACLRGALVVMVAGLALATTAPVERTAMAAASLVDLRGPGDLRAVFDADRGKTRVILLVSPT
ncbi:MAG TPA: hypothetical protein VGY48_29500 [Vicinamibacterales bacterium]|jgi:hypothetical protein|nr:hypothetical protein [Vicinamibacterales bacterium]